MLRSTLNDEEPLHLRKVGLAAARDGHCCQGRQYQGRCRGLRDRATGWWAYWVVIDFLMASVKNRWAKKTLSSLVALLV